MHGTQACSWHQQLGLVKARANRVDQMPMHAAQKAGTVRGLVLAAGACMHTLLPQAAAPMLLLGRNSPQLLSQPEGRLRAHVALGHLQQQYSP